MSKSLASNRSPQEHASHAHGRVLKGLLWVTASSSQNSPKHCLSSLVLNRFKLAFLRAPDKKASSSGDQSGAPIFSFCMRTAVIQEVSDGHSLLAAAVCAKRGSSSLIDSYMQIACESVCDHNMLPA